MSERFVNPFEDNTEALIEAATEINRASELTNTNPENSRETLIHERYVKNTLNPQGTENNNGNSN